MQPGPVTIERAILTTYFRHAAGQTSPQDVDVASVLGTTVIPPGQDGLTTTVTLDPASDEEVFSKTWALSGTSAEGYPASGSFSVMLPPPKPTADASTPVFDPLLKQKIILARQESSGKDVVDDEDIWRLDREGVFANLKVTPAQAAAASAAAAQQPPARPRQPNLPSRGPTAPTATSQQAQPGQGPGPAAPASSK